MAADYLSLIINSVVNIDFNGFVVPLLLYATLIAIYGIFVWAFYKSVSKRDLFKMNIKDGNKQLHVKVFYFLKYIVFFPVLTFIWFAGLSVILFFLSKSQTTENILLISMGLIAATRVTSYYKEELSQEIAKILPLAVIGIFVVDPSFFSLDITLGHFYQVPSLAPLLIQYLIFIVLMEFVFRVVLAIKRRIKSGRSHVPLPEKKQPEKKQKVPKKQKPSGKGDHKKENASA